ncbi:uncharacterized protein LOC116263253 [Nymphaea colorata]|nr:uncharacterized protein LOC116263253 [Nymphaea colorata]XP_031498774.1 uncharacterized protein LOC116263253 [Nymphaea colorata]
MLRAVIQRARCAVAVTRIPTNHSPFFSVPRVIDPKFDCGQSPPSSHSHPFSSASKSTGAKGSKAKPKEKTKGESPAKSEDAAALDDLDFDLPLDDHERAYDEDDKSLDIGPKGLPLFTQATSIAELTRKDVCSYMDFSMDELIGVLAEGLPLGITKEFEETKRSALLIRQSFLDLRDNFRRVVDPPIQQDSKSLKVRKQIVLDGPISCGKSIALAMLVAWARSQGWIVFYVPYGRNWTHGGFFYKNPQTGLWDTPIQATKILQDFLKFNEAQMQKLLCQYLEPIPLGEGAGVGMMKGVDTMAMPEGSTLYDLIQTGLTYSHASVGVVVHLRKELSLIKDIPVLIAVDQYNNWFTFSEYQEPVTARSCRPIHAKELSTVNAFRSMMHEDMMVGAFSHSTAVGKLRKDLPDVPLDARIFFPRYSLDEAAAVCHYYRRQRLIRRDGFSEDKWKRIYYLANGNGAEMRWLVPFM